MSVCIGWLCTFVKTHSSEASNSVSYVIDAEFEQVKKIMVRTDALEAIISHEQGSLVDRKYNDVVLSSGSIRQGFDIDAKSEFVVAKQDPDVGRLLLRFDQNVHLSKDGIMANTVLAEPVGYIKEVRTTMSMKPQGNQTSVTTAIYLRYERKVPKGMIEEVDRRVIEAAQRTLNNNKEAVLELVQKYGDKRFIIPIQKK